MEVGRYQYPSVTVSRTLKGNREYAQLFSGEANKLLYELKNLMSFRKLGQLKMTRFFLDGTVITAKSIFGQDFINIDVSQSIVMAIDAISSCTITFLNLPDVVAPMQYPNEIHTGEIEGQDYYKTYYTVDISHCPACVTENITLGLLMSSSEGWETGPFLFLYDDVTIPGRIHTPNNHSLYGRAGWAQILARGEDEGGKYFLWKAYTEEAGMDRLLAGQLQRTGLAYMPVRMAAVNAYGKEICLQQGNVTIDCCQKSGDARILNLYSTCPYFGGAFLQIDGDHYFLVPENVNINAWLGPCTARTNVGRLAVHLDIFPDIFGTCYPIEWTLEGPGELGVQEFREGDDVTMSGAWAEWLQPEEGIASLCDSIIITARDRCGEVATVRASCCEYAGAMEIFYTSLYMELSTQQVLQAYGGCPPYSWTASSGTITPLDQYGGNALYTSAAANVNCVANPTITVTDCCGTSASVKFAVGGGDPAWIAFEMCDWHMVGDCIFDITMCAGPPDGGHKYAGSFRMRRWDCAGDLLSDCSNNTWSMVCEPTCPEVTTCPTCGCDGAPGCDTTSGLTDVRDAAMKLASCCPINPITGLPYD